MPRRVPRKPRPKKVNVPKGYDSIWEYEIHQTVLKESGGQNTAIVSARDAANMLATVVNSLDDILRPHVNFSK